ncbi:MULTISPECIES: SAM-dependent methyltransferase [Nocardiopsidaceae]|uniref:Class I SAM-dependent methyltransferase n=1 Tax=Streptomonospora nanhaiensis TaxID=1323731 RepID=A0ABY6YNT1_9ACTN|nr:class I SAM-dependent methyltransferase [Streptomonospora nanhaiensis]WAE74039.1 class I SAM-dependent methyltransferase [Streptomonospora nanhaiensis]
MHESESDSRSQATSASELFDEYYLRFWEGELADDRLKRDVGLVLELAGLRPGDRILDVACGYGRMTNSLTVSGFDATGVDLSVFLLDEARARARALDVQADFRQRDMRNLWGMDGFACALLWFTSFGYFSDAENAQVLRQIFGCLEPGGRLLLETRHWDRMARRFDPVTVRSKGDDFLVEYHTYDAQNGVQKSRQTLLVDGRRIERTSFVRRYGFPEMRALALQAGFVSVRGYDENGGPLTEESDRCVLVAVK